MKHYAVTAVPHQGFDHYFRAGVRLGSDPVEIAVMDEEPKADAPREQYVLSPSEFDRLKADPRVRVEAKAAGSLGGAASPDRSAERPAKR